MGKKLMKDTAVTFKRDGFKFKQGEKAKVVRWTAENNDGTVVHELENLTNPGTVLASHDTDFVEDEKSEAG